MIIFAGLVFGALWGGMLARKRGGSRLDIAQYAGSFAIAGGILALFLSVFIDRML